MALLTIAKLTLNLSLRSLSSGFFAGAVHTAPRLACWRITSGELGGLFFDFFGLISNQCGDHPQIVGQYAPGDGEVPGAKSNSRKTGGLVVDLLRRRFLHSIH